MGFNTPNGTRGARQPSAGLMRLVNGLMAHRVRKNKKLMGDTNGLMLTTIGKKSGQERTNPVMWFPGSGGSWLIVASANGAPKNPAWYYNIAAHPDQVRIQVGDKKIAVHAEQLHGTAREDAWREIAGSTPRFAKYAEQTDRELPIIRLTERVGAG